MPKNDDRSRADKATVRLQRVKVQRNGIQAGGQNAARSTARQVGIKVVAVKHAAAIFIDKFLHRDARRGELDAGVFHPSTDAKAAQAFAPVAAKASKPLWAFFNDVAHPVKRFKVVLQRRPAKQTDLSNVRGAHTRLTAFAFNAFNHGGFFTANIGTGTAPELNQWQMAGRICLQFGNLGFQHVAAAVVFITQVDVAGFHANHLRRD